MEDVWDKLDSGKQPLGSGGNSKTGWVLGASLSSRKEHLQKGLALF